MPENGEESFVFLQELMMPRPLVWQPYVFQRRVWYGFLCILLLLVVVGIPIVYGIEQMTVTSNWEKIKFNQIAIVLGAVVVVAYVVFVHSLFKLYDDVKWLGQRGKIAEANILMTLHGPKKLIVSYRFWDERGREYERDAVIDLDESHPISELKPGMVVPILYDPDKPDHRSYLWAEAASYLTIRNPA